MAPTNAIRGNITQCTRTLAVLSTGIFFWGGGEGGLNLEGGNPSVPPSLTAALACILYFSVSSGYR